MSRYRYPSPANEDAFEEFCLVLLKQALSLPMLERYGHRGERQHGVDLVDMSGATPIVAAQCKHLLPHKSLPPTAIEAEVKKALGFPTRIGRYLFLTSGKKSTHAQDCVRAVNTRHSSEGLFSVQLLTWDEIERMIDDSPAAQAHLGLAIKANDAVEIPGASSVAQTIVQRAIEGAHAELDEAKAHLDNGELQQALFCNRPACHVLRASVAASCDPPLGGTTWRELDVHERGGARRWNATSVAA